MAGLTKADLRVESLELADDLFGATELRDLTLIWKGPDVRLIAREVGRAFKYAKDGKSLLNRIRGEWADEFVEGIHYEVIAGSDLADLKLVTDSVTSRAPSVMLLTWAGWDLVRMRSDKDVGRRLRAVLVGHVMPQFRTSGTASVAVEHRSESHPVAARERRLLQRESRLALQAAAKYATTDEMRHIIAVELMQTGTGRSYQRLLPVQTEDWKSPSEMADMWGVTSNRIGRIISGLGIREDSRYARPVDNKSQYSTRQVTSYQYNAAGQALIRSELERSGHLRLVDLCGDDE